MGARVYNRCTGDVLVSKPPSTGDRPTARRPGHEDPTCAGAKSRGRAREAATPPPASDELPPQLSKTLIADAMAKIRPQVFACYQQFKSPGTLELIYVVAGNGTVQSVAVGPAFAGTPTGQCVLEAAKDARFPAFKLDQQKFTYPFFLRAVVARSDASVRGAGGRTLGGRAARVSPRGGRSRGGQLEPEQRALPQPRRDAVAAVVPFDQAAHRRQPQAEARLARPAAAHVGVERLRACSSGGSPGPVSSTSKRTRS